MSSGRLGSQGLLALLALAVAQAAAADSVDFPVVSLSTGVNITNGTYGGTAEIEDIDVPLVFSIDYERWAFTAKVPYLTVHTTEGNQTTTESGIGDVTASITVFDVASDWERGLALDVTGAVKFGTADPDTGLGTGENDITLYLDGYKFYDSVTLLASIGHRWRGSTADAPLNDVLLATVGATIRNSGGSLFGVTYDYRESALEEYTDIREVRGFASFPMSDNWVLEFHAFTGLSDSGADWGGGLAIATQLRRFGFRTADY